MGKGQGDVNGICIGNTYVVDNLATSVLIMHIIGQNIVFIPKLYMSFANFSKFMDEKRNSCII